MLKCASGSTPSARFTGNCPTDTDGDYSYTSPRLAIVMTKTVTDVSLIV
jgi:hypothetical protein